MLCVRLYLILLLVYPILLVVIVLLLLLVCLLLWGGWVCFLLGRLIIWLFLAIGIVFIDPVFIQLLALIMFLR